MLRPLIFVRDKCLACRTCELACAVVHSRTGSLDSAVAEDPPPRRRVSVVRTEEGIEALRCEQCLEPLCLFSCKTGALHWSPGEGRTAFDEDRCVGCLMCAMVCAYGIRPDSARDRVARCDVCDGLDTPACVAACPTHALLQGDPQEERAQSAFGGHLVIVGSSAAGMAACEAAAMFAPACTVTLVTADRTTGYSRPLLPYVLAGRLEPERLQWRRSADPEGCAGATVIGGTKAIGVDPAGHTLRLEDGRDVPFDRLIIATGAKASIPRVSGLDLGGVHVFRDLEDLTGIRPAVQPGRHAVVIGGGNVGLQVAEALAERAMQVTVVVRSAHLLSQMVDPEAGRRVGDLFTRHGAVVRTGRDVSAILGADRVEKVLLDDGERLSADLVVIGKGVEPNVAWLAGSGIAVRRGVVIDRSGRTNVPDVFAAGDCAEAPDPVTGLSVVSAIWPVAYEMARAAAATAVGIERTTRGALRMNASRFFGVPIVSIGEVRPERLSGATAHVLADGEDSYRKLVLRGGRLAGALLYGDITGAGIYYRLYRDAVDVSGVPAESLGRERIDLVVGAVRSALSR